MPHNKQFTGLDILHPFKQRKDERRLTDELRDYMRQMQETKEEMIRLSTSIGIS